MTNIPRNVSIDQTKKPMRMDDPANSELASRVARQTWQTRYPAILSAAGYNTGKRIIKATPASDWLATTQDYGPMGVYIDSVYFFYATRFTDTQVDITQFKYCQAIMQPIRFFMLDVRNNSEATSNGAYRFLQLLHSEQIKVIFKFDEQRHEDFLDTKTNGDSTPRRNNNLQTISPHMIISIMQDVYENKLKHVVVVSRDNLLSPLVQYLHTKGVKVTLALADMTMSNYYLQQFDYIVDLREMLEVYNVLTGKSERS